MYAKPDFVARVSCRSRGRVIAFLLKGNIPQTLNPAITFFMVIAFIQALEKSCENE